MGKMYCKKTDADLTNALSPFKDFFVKKDWLIACIVTMFCACCAQSQHMEMMPGELGNGNAGDGCVKGAAAADEMPPLSVMPTKAPVAKCWGTICKSQFAWNAQMWARGKARSHLLSFVTQPCFFLRAFTSR